MLRGGLRKLQGIMLLQIIIRYIIISLFFRHSYVVIIMRFSIFLLFISFTTSTYDRYDGTHMEKLNGNWNTK
jgi:hypothetical protein